MDEAGDSLLGGLTYKERRQHEKENRSKKVALIVIGIFTFLYCLVELAAAVYTQSLALLSDGFHNLSDVLSLGIAYWAITAGEKGKSDSMTYGWKRTEVIGGLINGTFLLALALYIVLDAIPRFISPLELVNDKIFMIVAGAGLAINLIGTIVFAATGTHAHQHVHEDGDDHGHGHGHSHGHSHGEKKKKKHDHDHDHDHDHEHQKDKKKKHDHEHDHDHEHKKDKKKKHDHDHDHDHDHAKSFDKETTRDYNMWAVFIHYLGDAISSALVLGTGVLMHFFGDKKWIVYADPVSSLVIVGIVLATTIPLVRSCAAILMQRTPNRVDVKKMKAELRQIRGLVNIHDLHVWQLGDDMSIGTIHIACQRTDNPVDFEELVSEVKRVFHKYGIHSTTVQPEFVNGAGAVECQQNCVEECEEDWCCKDAVELPVVHNYDSFGNNSVNGAIIDPLPQSPPSEPIGFSHIV